MGNEAMATEINDMLNPTDELEGEDGVVSDDTSIVDDDAGVAGEDIIADAVGAEGGELSTDTPSVTDVAQVGGEPAAGAGEDDVPFVESIDDIRARIAEMSTPAQPVQPEGDAIINPLDAFKDDIPYITEESLAEIADNPLLLNAAMNNVRRQTAENLLTIVPNLIQSALQAHTVRQETHNAFYGKHAELVPYKAYVSSVAKDIQAKNPDKTQGEILDLVAKSVKASLKIAPTKGAAKDKKQGGKPALRKASGGSRAANTAVPATDMAAQIADLL